MFIYFHLSTGIKSHQIPRIFFIMTRLHHICLYIFFHPAKIIPYPQMYIVFFHTSPGLLVPLGWSCDFRDPSFSIAACHAIVFGPDFGRLRHMNDQLRWDRDRIEELNQVFKNFARVSWCCCIFRNYRPTQWHQKTTGEISKKTMWIWYGMILEGNGGKTHMNKYTAKLLL